jgi:hypothetical protein
MSVSYAPIAGRPPQSKQWRQRQWQLNARMSDVTSPTPKQMSIAEDAAFDARWGNFVFNGYQFTKMVHAGLQSKN